MPPETDDTQRSASKRSTAKRRLTLMESYGAGTGAFSDAHLQEISAKIRGITAQETILPASEKDQTAPSDGHSIEVSIDKSIEVSITPSIDTSIETPINTVIDTLTETQNEIPNDISNERVNDPSSQTTNGSPILLTEAQAILYYCIKWLDGVVTSLNRISQETGISEHTLRGCLTNLTKKGAIQYGGRSNYGGRIGFTAEALPCNILLRDDRHRLLQKLEQINYRALTFAQPFGDTFLENSEIPHMRPQMKHLMKQQMDTSNQVPSCSSSKKQLLLGLILEDAFAHLNPQSLLPHLTHIETADELQGFLDVANACIAASKTGNGKPIKNPQGFLIAQLKLGYINPPEGYKSRRVRAQESRNQRLEQELAELQRLKKEEKHLRFEVFKARLSSADDERLTQEAGARVNPRSAVSVERQIEVAKEEILREWFARQE